MSETPGMDSDPAQDRVVAVDVRFFLRVEPHEHPERKMEQILRQALPFGHWPPDAYRVLRIQPDSKAARTA